MLLESQYSQFKEDLNKPKGGTAFITDFDRKELLAITHGRANHEPTAQTARPVSAAIAMAPPPPQKMEEENSDLPKFEDDWCSTSIEYSS